MLLNYLRNIALIAGLLLTSFTAFGQEDSFVKVKGILYAAADSTPVDKARVLYEKLPYYDDMGMVSSNNDGFFEFLIVKGNSYDINVSASGYEEVSETIGVKLEDPMEEISLDLYLPIAEELRLIKLENLIFDRGSSRITPDSFSELDDLARWLDERSDKIIQLEGHTDFQGNDKANMELSQERVDAVKEYLVNKGIDKRRVKTKAFGGTQPITKERTDEAKEMNRRVEVRVIN